MAELTKSSFVPFLLTKFTMVFRLKETSLVSFGTVWEHSVPPPPLSPLRLPMTEHHQPSVSSRCHRDGFDPDGIFRVCTNSWKQPDLKSNVSVYVGKEDMPEERNLGTPPPLPQLCIPKASVSFFPRNLAKNSAAAAAAASP